MYNVHTYTQIVSYIFFQISVNRAIKLKGAACRYLFAIFSQKLNKSNLQTRMDFLRRIFVYVVRLVFSTRHCARVCVWQSSLAAVIVPIMWACMWPMCGLWPVCGVRYFVFLQVRNTGSRAILSTIFRRSFISPIPLLYSWLRGHWSFFFPHFDRSMR